MEPEHRPFREQRVANYEEVFGFASVHEALQARFSQPASAYLERLLALLCRPPALRSAPVEVPEGLVAEPHLDSEVLRVPRQYHDPGCRRGAPAAPSGWPFDTVWLFEELPADEAAVAVIKRALGEEVAAGYLRFIEACARDGAFFLRKVHPGLGDPLFEELVNEFRFPAELVSRGWKHLKTLGGDLPLALQWLERQQTKSAPRAVPPSAAAAAALSPSPPRAKRQRSSKPIQEAVAVPVLDASLESFVVEALAELHADRPEAISEWIHDKYPHEDPDPDMIRILAISHPRFIFSETGTGPCIMLDDKAIDPLISDTIIFS